ncbi:MAG: hypothetical protein DWQ02_14565 [Bacteroidetes bacterium]|nr:MAG: hypothetical protein DWQ02_14565 [Bacteroidota bacterium]
MLNIIYILGGILVARAFFSIVGSVFKSSEKAASSYMSVVFKMLQLRLLAAALVILFFFFIMGKLNLKFNWGNVFSGNKASLSPIGWVDDKEDMEDSKDWKYYRAGDSYVKDGIKYKLVDKNKYKLNNLDHFPTIELSGKTFYLVRKPS